MNPVVVRKKTGLPDEDTILDPLHLQCYTPLCKYLNETKKLAVTEQILSQFSYNILQFMEESKTFGHLCLHISHRI
jgi:hypothetical protein